VVTIIVLKVDQKVRANRAAGGATRGKTNLDWEPERLARSGVVE
jgi:hypothetical protein